ncbi:MAG TPA: septum formation family protein [Pseudonocardiaceae bacterium]
MSRRSTGPDGGRPPAARGARRVEIGAVVGAALALATSSLLALGGGGTGAGEEEGPREFAAPVGTCLDWTAADGSDVRAVDCATAHLFEAVGTVDLSSAFGPAAAFPAETAWLPIVQEKCTALAVEYLNGRYDPFGRFTVGALKPSQAGWRADDRTLHCGLQVVAQSGELYRTEGGARGQDQADIHQPGTCLGIDGVDVGDPVDCAQPHAVEVVGVVDFSVAFPESDYPDEAKQDAAAEPVCTQLAATYAGGPTVVADKKLTVYWDTLHLESWKAGTRKVDCKLGALLPDKSGFAPVTGGVQGVVAIGATPAPPAPETATPGAPAPLPAPLPLPPSTTPPATPAPTSTPGT